MQNVHQTSSPPIRESNKNLRERQTCPHQMFGVRDKVCDALADTNLSLFHHFLGSDKSWTINWSLAVAVKIQKSDLPLTITNGVLCSKCNYQVERRRDRISQRQMVSHRRGIQISLCQSADNRTGCLRGFGGWGGPMGLLSVSQSALSSHSSHRPGVSAELHWNSVRGFLRCEAGVTNLQVLTAKGTGAARLHSRWA